MADHTPQPSEKYARVPNTAPYFDISAPSQFDTVVPGDIDYLNATAADAAYAVNLLRHNVRQILIILADAGLITVKES